MNCTILSVALLTILGIIVLISLVINSFIKIKTKKKIVKIGDNLQKVDAIMVLGCKVRKNGYPGIVLKHRLDKAIEAYRNGYAEKILVTGNHGTVEYDEVNSMKNYLKAKGIPSEKIFMDHAGFTTYESMYRAKYVFEVNKMLIITQQYHLYRSLYIAEKFDIEVYGISAVDSKYKGRKIQDLREFFARLKNFIKCIYKPKPRFLGKVISIKGNGNLTNDK